MQHLRPVYGFAGVLCFCHAAGCSTASAGDTQNPPSEVEDPVIGADQKFGKDELPPESADLAEGGTPDAGGGVANISPLARVPDPLPGVTPAERARFQAGLVAFQEIETVADGLGPIFNGNSCGGCHSQPGPGGASHFFEGRFGRLSSIGDAGVDAAGVSLLDAGGAGLVFDSLLAQGGTLQQFFSIGSEGAPSGCSFPIEIIPPAANVRTLRRTTSLHGLGLVDNVPEAELRLLASIEATVTPTTAGHVAVAVNLSNMTPTVSKFGWKAQVPTLFQFSGNAYVNEMGITNPEFPIENCPNDLPDCDLVRRCNPAPGLNDDGEDVVAFTDFMTFLAPLPRGATTASVTRGQAVFTKTGCANCHTPTLFTGPNSSAALDRKEFHPYSDFLLHDMGTGGDGIGPDQGNASLVEVNATPTEMRTAPLWGLRDTTFLLLHDGRAHSVGEAVTLGHFGQASHAREKFLKLSQREQDDLTAFVLSL